MGERADDDECEGYTAPDVMKLAIDIASERALTLIEQTHALVALDVMLETERRAASELRQLRHAVAVSEEMRRQAVRERDEARWPKRSHPLIKVSSDG